MRLTPRQQRAKDRYIRKKYEKDLIQPSDDSRFKKHYPEQHAEMEKAMEREELKAKQKKESKDKFFKKYKTGTHSKEMRNMLKLEEQLEYGRK